METKEKFLYLKIYDDIIEKIKNGTLNIGDKLPTEYELMEAYNVSRITATRAFSALADEGYIIRKRHSGSFVAATDSSVISVKTGGVKKELRHIALIFDRPESLGGSDSFVRFIQDAFYNRMLVSVFITLNDLETERKILTALYDSDIDAVISIPITSYKNIEYYERLRIKGIPVIFIDLHIPWSTIPYISFTNEESMYKLTKWVISQNLQKIAFCFVSETITSEAERFKGYLRAITEYRIVPRSDYIICTDHSRPLSEKGYSTEEQRCECIRLQLKEYLRTNTMPEVIMCVNDLTARLVIKEAMALGIKIPEQLSVTGFEGNSDIKAAYSSMLTTVKQDYSLIVKKISEVLLLIQRGIEVKDPVYIDTEMIIRTSVKLKNASDKS